MKSRKVRLTVAGVLLLFALSMVLLQPLLNFQTQYFDTPDQAMAHSSGMRQDSNIVQTLYINTEYGFAFGIDDNNALCIKDLDSWTLFHYTRYCCQDGFSSENYVCNLNDIGIYSTVNYYNEHGYFSRIQKVPSKDNMVIGGLTRLSDVDTLLIDGKKPDLHPVEISGNTYTIWYVKNNRLKGTIIDYDGQYFCTL